MPRTLFSGHRLLVAASLAFILAPGAWSLAAPNDARETAAFERGQRYTAALNLLERHGYASFSNFREEANQFAADVVENGATRHVLIDPDSGQIMAAGPANAGEETRTGGAR